MDAAISKKLIRVSTTNYPRARFVACVVKNIFDDESRFRTARLSSVARILENPGGGDTADSERCAGTSANHAAATDPGAEQPGECFRACHERALFF